VQDIVYALWASGAHDVRNDDLTDRALERLPPHVQHGELTGGELAKLAWGLVQQDVGDTRIFELVADAVRDALPAMYPRDIAKLTWALGQARI
jgi:hypothetical protein